MDYSERTKFNFEDDLLGEQAVNKFLVDFLYEKFKEKGYIKNSKKKAILLILRSLES